MRARWLLPLVSLAIILLVVAWEIGSARSGPGPLHPAHARLPELAQGTRCAACHLAGAGLDAEACTRCHTAIAAQAAARTGLHGGMVAEELARCEHCHGEHHGDTAPLIPPHAFARVGFPDPAAYDHRHVVFGLTGAHARLACVRCHEHADAQQPPAGGRFLGLSQQCTSCHDDAHRGAFSADCAGCHGQERPWRLAPGFAHGGFPLVGAHQQVACDRCHATGTEHDVAALRRTPQPARSCAACHDNPHGGSDRPATALRLDEATDCARCHDATAWANARPTAAQHAVIGFVLRGAHAQAACASCHGDAHSARRWRGAVPELAACASCHEHPHRPELMAAATATTGPAAGCAGCHRDEERSFRDGSMPVAMHAAAGMPLVAPHADVACARCHAGDTRAARFPGRAASDCRACHRDVHRGEFDLDPRHRQCTACHLPTAFHPALFGVAAHQATRFPLTGAHDAVACGSCHRTVVDGVRSFRGAPSECSRCHDDVHKGAFDRPGRPTNVAERKGCARCHDTQAFAPAAAFDHALWTGYELVGAHARTDCALCHQRPSAGAGGAAPRLGRAPGTRCSLCHADPHAGQFESAGSTDCARCHDSSSFRDVHFDHQRTRFPLDEVHRAVACGKCHLGVATPAGTVVRYRPLGTTCGDCHRLGTGPAGRR
jgi:hypothetical protein